MKEEPTIDAEKLAALLDGRLNEPDRRELLARLADSRSDLSVFADAAAVASELGLVAANDSVEPSIAADPAATAVGAGHGVPVVVAERRAETRAHYPWRNWRPYAAAATIAVLAGVSWWASQRHDTSSAPTDVVALIDQSRAGLPADWDGEPWAVTTRGVVDNATERARAARIGARLVDLEIATLAGDTVAASIARDIVQLLDGVPASGPASSIFEKLSERSAPSGPPIALVRQGRRAVAGLVEQPALEEASWAEAARIAAARHDSGFFTSAASRRIAERMATNDARPEVAAAMTGLSRRVAGDTRDDWTSTGAAATTVLRAMTR